MSYKLKRHNFYSIAGKTANILRVEMELVNRRTLILAFITITINLINANIINRNVERSIDLSSHLVKEIVKITAEDSDTPIKEYVYMVPADKRSKLAFISIKDSYNKELQIQENTYANQISFKILFPTPMTEQVISVNVVYTKDVTAYPMEIKQAEKQLVQYVGNLYLYSPYLTETQKLTIKLSSSNILSHTQVKPFTVSSNKIKYGPYDDIKEFANQSLLLHYENESPFLTVKYLERTIEVSHWGNIAVKESIYIDHSGAKLKGSFSRYDFQKDGRSGLSAVKSFKTILPASAADVYYRDSNGNISTSNMKVLRDHVELELKPRFPLFGGWKTHYILGYNVPSFEYLYNLNEKFMLKMRLIDHIYDDMIIDEALIKIILPEGSTNIELNTPYNVNRNSDEVFFTYLDIVGRPVISFFKKNLVENHIANFTLKYTFSSISLLFEPLLVTVFIFIIFICTIILLRLDFSITTHSHKDHKD